MAGGDLSAAGEFEVDPGGPGQSWGLTLSVTCNDQVPFYTPAVLASAADGVDPVLAAAVKKFVIDPALADCAAWPHDMPDPNAGVPVVTAVPVLLLLGRYDPIAPLKYGTALQQSMSRATIVVAQQSSHGVAFAEPICAGSQMSRFLADLFRPIPRTTAEAGLPCSLP